MRATKEYVEKVFNEFNGLCFEGALPPLPIEVTQARTFLGVFTWRKRRGEDGSEEPCEMKLRISTVYDLDEKEVEDTIIHEMIHYYITYNKIQDTSSHGEVFKRLMNEINEKYGRNITISHRGSNEEKATDKRKQDHFVCVCESAWDLLLGQFSYGRIPKIHQELSQDERIKKISWYHTNNPFFNRFPTSTKVRLLKINRMELIDNLKDATELECDGLRVRTKRK